MTQDQVTMDTSFTVDCFSANKSALRNSAAYKSYKSSSSFKGGFGSGSKGGFGG